MDTDPRVEAAARKMFAIGNERTKRSLQWDEADDLRAIYLDEAAQVLAAADAVDDGWEWLCDEDAVMEALRDGGGVFVRRSKVDEC